MQMRYTKPLAAGCALALALGAAACGSSNSSSSSSSSSSTGGTLNGAGSTFQAPLVGEWAKRFKDSNGVTVNYDPIGSGGGIAQFSAGTVDFGGTDSAMKPDEQAAAQKKGAPLHIPIALGAVTVSYDVSGVKAGLKLDGATIASIFLGKVTKWNDPAIAGLNAGVTLPSTAITVCHRSDESGTTKGFTAFLVGLLAGSGAKVGSDKSVQWPTGTGAKGNDGVAAAVKQTQGAVGYVEQAYALQNDFTTAEVKNKAGNSSRRRWRPRRPPAPASTPPADLRLRDDRRRRRAGLPDRGDHVPLDVAGPVQVRALQAGGDEPEGVVRLRARRGPVGRAAARVRRPAGPDQGGRRRRRSTA